MFQKKLIRVFSRKVIKFKAIEGPDGENLNVSKVGSNYVGLSHNDCQ